MNREIKYEFNVAYNYRYLASYTSLTAVKQATNKHYKKQTNINQTFNNFSYGKL